MLFTWDTENLCIVFRQWHVSSNLSLVVSLAAIVAICAGYEALREATRRYEAMLSKRVETAPRKCVFCVMTANPLAKKTVHLTMESPDPRRRRRGTLKIQLLRQPPFWPWAQARTETRSRGGPTSPRRCCTASRTFTLL